MSAIIQTTITSILSEILQKTSRNIIQKFKINRFIKKINKGVQAYCLKNECLYFNSSAFIYFLNHHKPIDKIIYNSIALSESKPTEDLIKELVEEAIEVANSQECILSMDDKNHLFGLFEYIAKNVNNFFNKELDQGQRYTISQYAQMNQILIKGFNDLNEVKREELSSIKKMINESNYINPYVERTFVLLICRKMWLGQFGELSEIMPIVKGKSQDIEIVETVLNNEMLKEINYRKDRASLFERIKDDRIRDCIIRNIIPLMYFRNESFDEIDKYTSSDYLKSIMSSLDNRDYSYLFSKNVEIKNGIEYQTISLNKTLSLEEDWLIKQIIAIYMYKMKHGNVAKVIETLLEGSNSWFTILLVYDLKADFLSYEGESKNSKEELKKLKERLIDDKNIYSKLSNDLEALFFALLLKIEILLDNNEIDSRIIIPNELLQVRPVEDYLLAIKIIEEKTSFEEVYEFCKKTEEYWLLLNYIVSIKNKENDLIELFEKHKEIIEKDEKLFFIYAESLVRIGDIERVRKELNEYKEKYGLYFEYWNVFLNIDNSDSTRNELISICNSDKILCTSGYSFRVLIERLLSFKEYKLANKYNNRLEIQYSDISIAKKYKAFILNGLHKYIDSLELFKELFDENPDDSAVIKSIISLSIQMKRSIDKKYIYAAEKANNKELLVYAGNAYASQGKYIDAHRCNMRALFLSDDYNNLAFNQYLGLGLLNRNNMISTISCAEKDTFVTIKSIDTSHLYFYCIHADNDLPESPLIWNGDMHVYIDEAAKDDIYRKKVGDEVIFNEQKCIIQSIEPLESYITRICFENIIKNGSGKAITAKIENNQLDKDALIEQLKTFAPDKNKKIDWIQQYNNYEDIALSLYMYRRNYNTSYSQFVELIVEDTQTCVREMMNDSITLFDRYILTFTSLIILRKIEFPLSVLRDKKVFIPESMFLQIVEDTREILSRYSQEKVSSMGQADGELFIIETDDKTKNKWIKEAGELKYYASEIPYFVNNHDWELQKYDETNIVDLLGIPDYDAMAIANSERYTLIGTEVMVTGLALDTDMKINVVSLTNFFIKIEIDAIDLLEYVKKLIKCGCIYAINKNLIEYIIMAEGDYNETQKERMYSSWDSLLTEFNNIPDSSKPYAIDSLKNILINYWENSKEFVEHPVLMLLIKYLMRCYQFEPKESYDNLENLR